MLKKIYYLLIASVSAVFLLCSCNGKSPREEFEITLTEYGKFSGEIDGQELRFLEDFVVSHKHHRDFRQFFTNGVLDQTKLVSYIEQKGYHIDLGVSSPANITINIYLENSGSMNGYVTGNTHFKDDFRELLVLLKNAYGEERINVYFINSEIHPTGIEGELVDIPSKLSPETIRVGNTAASELNTIFKQVLAHTSEDTISILLSDCIYSVGKGDTGELLSAHKSLTKDAFLSRFNPGDALSTVIVKLNSSFNGWYYDKNDKPINLGTGKVERPYYLTIIGGEQVVADFEAKIGLSEGKFKGFENKQTFSAQDFSGHVFYSVISAKSDRISWQYIRKGGSELARARMRKRDALPLTFSVAVDFSNIPVAADYILHTENYKVSQGYELIAVEPYNQADLSPTSVNRIRHAAASPTHRLVFQVTDFRNLVFSLKKQLPQWIDDTDTGDDADIHSVLDKTFGFRYLMAGISEAYENESATDSRYFEMTINIQK